MLTLFHLDGVYMIHSEYEVESGYADILLTKDARWEKWITWEWAIEIKYLKEAERERLKTAKTEARAQLARYTVPVPGGRPSSESLKTAALLVIGKGEVEVG